VVAILGFESRFTMTEVSYSRYEGPWGAETSFQRKLVQETLAKVCDVAGCPMPTVVYWAENRTGRIDPNGRSFAFECNGWQDGSSPRHEINIVLSTRSDDGQDIWRLPITTKHELAHLLESWNPVRAQANATISASGARCSTTAKQAYLLTDEGWRGLVLDDLRHFHRVQSTLAKAREWEECMAPVGGSLLDVIGPRVAEMRAQAAEMRRAKQRPAVATRSAAPAPVAGDAELGWIEDPTTHRVVRPSRRVREPRTSAGLEIAGSVTGGIISIR
jgi:hypothetical protein